MPRITILEPEGEPEPERAPERRAPGSVTMTSQLQIVQAAIQQMKPSTMTARRQSRCRKCRVEPILPGDVIHRNTQPDGREYWVHLDCIGARRLHEEAREREAELREEVAADEYEREQERRASELFAESEEEPSSSWHPVLGPH